MSSEEDNGHFKAYGMPIMLICTYTVSLLLSHKALMRAFHTSRGNTINFAIFLGSIGSSIASMLLYFSPAWAYGLVCTAVCYMFALVIGSSAGGTNARFVKMMFGVVAVWFALLVGIPDAASRGIVAALSHSNCQSFYGDEADSMCHDGWLNFLQVIAMVLVSVNFLTLLTLMNAAFEATDPAHAQYVTLVDPADAQHQQTSAVPSVGGPYSPTGQDTYTRLQ